MTVYAMTCFCQTTFVNYSDKCIKQRKTAWVLAGTGVALATTGYLITEIDGNGEQSVLSENFNVGAWTFIAGLATCLGSLPFFLSAHNNCKKSKKIGISIHNIESLSSLSPTPKRLPSISLRVRLP